MIHHTISVQSIAKLYRPKSDNAQSNPKPGPKKRAEYAVSMYEGDQAFSVRMNKSSKRYEVRFDDPGPGIDENSTCAFPKHKECFSSLDEFHSMIIALQQLKVYK